MSSFQRETKLGMAVFIELLLELYRASSCPRALIRLFAYEKNAKYLRVALRIAMLIGSGYEDGRSIKFRTFKFETSNFGQKKAIFLSFSFNFVNLV